MDVQVDKSWDVVPPGFGQGYEEVVCDLSGITGCRWQVCFSSAFGISLRCPHDVIIPLKGSRSYVSMDGFTKGRYVNSGRRLAGRNFREIHDEVALKNLMASFKRGLVRVKRNG